MRVLSRYFLPVLVASFAIACLYQFRGDLAQMSFAPIARSWDLVALAALCSLVNYGCRILRWQRYLHRLGRRLPLGFTCLTYIAGFAFTVSPGKVGEIVRARYYSRLGVSLSDVAGAFFVERLVDVMAMLGLAALIVSTLPHYHAAVWTAGGMVAAAFAALGILPWSAIVRRLEATRQPPVGIRWSTAAARALASARALLDPATLFFGFLLALVAWGAEGLGLYLLSMMFPEAHLSASVGVGIYAVAVLAGAISFVPGGLGGTEAVMTALLASQGFSVGDAILVTVVCRLVTLWLAVLIGWLAVLVMRKRLMPAVSSPWP